MDRRKPRCGETAAHAPHVIWSHGSAFGPSWTGCPGWTAREAGATLLADRLDQAIREAAWPLAMPPGIRLECCPSVPSALQDLFIPSFAEFTAGLHAGGDAVKPQIPVTVTAEMGAGQWRITADDGLIAEGIVSDG